MKHRQLDIFFTLWDLWYKKCSEFFEGIKSAVSKVIGYIIYLFIIYVVFIFQKAGKADNKI